MTRFYKITAALLFVLVFASCKKDLLHWKKVQQISTNTTCRLNHVKFIGASICLATGGDKYQKSEILRSEDGGYTFTSYSDPKAEKGMYGFGQSPSGKIYLCGDGTAMFSGDSGKTWNQDNPRHWLFYQGVAYPTEDTGVYVSTVTEEFGAITQVDASFKVINELNFKFGLHDIYMTSQSTGYVIGYGAVMKTTDYRHTWQFQDVKGDFFMCMDIHGDEIWMCGYNGGIFHTTDGGAHWEKLRNGNDITLVRYHLYGIVFKDKQHGWAAGDNGKLLYSDDAGHHWAEYDHFTDNALRSIALCPNGDLLVAGDNGTMFRIILN
jgi:photosystem II stability/assembly factor-like uncharacterized protein